MAVFAGKTNISNGGNNDRAILGKFYEFPNTFGDQRIVYSGATGAGTGVSPADAYTTLIAAQTGATASNDDTIYVLPGHAEDVAGAAAMTFSKAGITYKGVGKGRTRPVLTWKTSTAAQIIVSGAQTTFENIVFDFTGIDAVVAAISVTAADVTFRNCEFITNVAAAGAVLGIVTAATAARLTVEDCKFLGTFANSGTTTTAQIKHEVGVDYVIQRNYFVGKLTQAILNATAITNGLIADNYFHIGTGTEAISMHASSAGLVTNNRICVASGTAPVIGAAMSYTKNSYTTEGNGPTGGTADAI
jgi:hypothetical protein